MTDKKTNAMRILDQHKISYGIIYYECENFTNGVDVAKKTNVPVEQNFKTLVAQGKSERYSVFVLPVAEELDMKKAAKAVDEKSIDLIAVKDINRITGYVRGGCSPLGIKRSCRTIIHESAKDFDIIYVSGGKIGCTISLSPIDLSFAANAAFGDIILKQGTTE